jgi:hypothetical protein
MSSDLLGNWTYLLFAILFGAMTCIPANASERMELAAEKLTSVLIEGGHTEVSIGEIKQKDESTFSIGPGIRAEFLMAFESVNANRKSNGKELPG